MKHRIEYILTLSLCFSVRILPYRLCLFIADILGDIFNYIIGMRKQVCKENLKKSFPEKSEREINRICKGTYRNISSAVIDLARLPTFTKKRLGKILTVHNLPLLDDALSEGKGVLIVAGHFGSWEVMGITFPELGYPMSFLVGEQRNVLVDDLMNKYRASHKVGIIKMGVASRGVLKALKNNECVAFLSDQDAGRDGILVDFLGRKASTPKGAGAFALKSRAPIIMAFPVRAKGGKINLYLERVGLSNLPEDKNEAIKEITQRYTNVLERYIRKYPEHYFWMHRRWKSTGG